MFQAQKLMAETQVASARFIPRRVPVLCTVAVLTFFTEPVDRRRGVNLAEILRPTSIDRRRPFPRADLRVGRTSPHAKDPCAERQGRWSLPNGPLVLARACRHLHRASSFGKRAIAV